MYLEYQRMHKFATVYFFACKYLNLYKIFIRQVYKIIKVFLFASIYNDLAYSLLKNKVIIRQKVIYIKKYFFNCLIKY